MPTSSKIKNLHLAKSVAELNKKAEHNIPAVNDALKCCISAQKLFEKANEFYEKGDEENAYLKYMRFLSFSTNILNCSSCKKNPDIKKSCSTKLSSNIAKALEKAETLQKHLFERYSLLTESIKAENHGDDISIKPDVSNAINESKEMNIIENGLKSVPSDNKISEIEKKDNCVSSTSLYHMIKSADTSLLILDVRSAKDYEYSHIKSESCINVPCEILIPGKTAAAIEKELSGLSISLWQKRGIVDFVILLDWKSTKEEINIQHPIYTLHEAINKWDMTQVLKSNPLLLEGGYEDWVLHYPMHTTNPNVDIISSIVSSTVPNLNYVVDVEYPNLDEDFTDISLKPMNINSLEKRTTIDSKIPFVETIDPMVSYAEMPNMLPINYITSKIEGLHLNNDIASDLSKQVLNNKNVSDSNVTPKPVVNRMLKPSPLIISKPSKISHKNESNEDSISNNLLKEEEMLKENIKVQKECLEKEKQFEMFRVQKLYQAEESMRLELQKQEEEMLAKIRSLEVEAETNNFEYQKLKEENTQIKQKLEGQEQELEQLKRLNHMETEKKKLMDEVTRLRKERKLQEEEKKKAKNIPDQLFEMKNVDKQMDISHFNTSAIQNDDTEYKTPLKGQISSEGRKRSLSRSHSSPNIAQLVAEEEEEDKCNKEATPQIDRTLKPARISETFLPSVDRNLKPEEINAARLRNLQPVFGNQGAAVTGLRNLGNTCFMNSVIQCLSLTVPLSLYFTRGKYKADINRTTRDSSRGEVTEEFAAVIRALWTGVYRSIAPKDFKNTVSKFLSVCVGYEQQDSHEFLIALLEKLHGDLNKSKVIMPNQTLDLDNLPEAEALQKFWKNHTILNISVISELFEGLLQSALTCLSCNKKSNSYEVFSFLSLPIPSNNKCSLKECLELFLKSEKMTGDGAWDCPRCVQKKEANKKMTICKLPKILVLHLKRFSYEGMWRRKLQTFVDFPIELEMQSFVSGQKSTLYRLYGVVNHYGTLEGGHYVAYCKNSVFNRWFKYDDHEVSDMFECEVATSAAYLLFYSCLDFQQC